VSCFPHLLALHPHIVWHQSCLNLQRFSDVGVTVLIASHDHSLISALNPRLLTLDQGTMIVGGDTEIGEHIV